MSSPPILLLDLLADAKFHSGEEVAKVLGITRAGVWKQLQKLESFGLEYESKKGKGYRLLQTLNMLNRSTIMDRLEHPSIFEEVEILFSTSSTNTAIQSKLTHTKSPIVIIAEHQSAGRGRRGKTWLSPFGKNIYLSMSWRFNEGMSRLDGLSLVVGLAVIKMLEFAQIEGVKLKWPNDLMLNNKKIGGILLEISGDPLAECSVIIGIGLNVNVLPSRLAIDQPWSSLKIEEGKEFDRNLLVSVLLNSLAKMLTIFAKEGFEYFYPLWNKVDWLQNREVCIYQGDNVDFGKVVGVSKSGALMLDSGQVYKAGEVSVRRSS